MRNLPSQHVLRSSLALALAAPGAFVLTNAQAQGDATLLAPVTVTGEAPDPYQTKAVSQQKFTAPLLDTPRTITVIPEALIKDRAASSLVDVLRTAPGITFGAGEGGTPVGDRPFVRGYESSTDILIDGMRDLGRGSHETFNLESVEILKGPGSAFSGRGSTGGSINLVSKTPKLKNFAEFSAGYGTDNNYRVTGDGNWMFTDNAAFRLNLMKTGGDVPGRDYVEIERYGIAPSLSFGLGTPTRVTLSYYHLQNDDMPDLGQPFKNESNPGRLTPLDVDRSNFYGRTKTDYRKNAFDQATVSVEHDINSHFTVRNTSRWGKSVNDYLLTRPSFDNCAKTTGRNAAPNKNYMSASCVNETQFQRDFRANYQVNESLFNLTELIGDFKTGSVLHTVAFGAEFSREEISKKAVTVTGLGSEIGSVRDPNPNRTYNYSISRGPLDRDVKTSSLGLYAFDTIKFNEQWEANLGLRYDDYKVNTYGTSPQSRRDGLWNYQAGLVYKPASNGSIYVSYGTSSNPAGETAGQSGGADGAAGGGIRDLAPEKSRSWELGTKWDLIDNRLSLTGALFETKKTDARSFDPITGDVTLSGSNRVRGVELGVSGAITPNWSVWGGYVYLDPKVLDYQAGAGGENFAGKQMKFVAKQSFSLWTTYKVLPQVTVGGGATYVGKRYMDDANQYYLPATWTFDAMAKYQLNKSFALQLNVNNIGNKTVYDASHVGLFALVGPGRSAMLTATYRFE